MKSAVTSKLTQLIHDEAMKQLAENYHELLTKLIKIDVDHIEEDMSYAVGAAYFMVGGRVIFIPVIYRDGSVDSISYIGDTENETLYGLTKKMYKRIISSTKLEFGKALGKKEQERLMIDKGIIGRLFATPQTISPKVASDDNYQENIIIDMLNSPVFANSFEKLASMPEYRVVLDKVYSERVFTKLATVQRLEKVAAAVYNDDTEMVYTKIADLAGLQQKKRTEAAMAIAKDGFYKVASEERSKAAVLGLPKLGETLLKAGGTLEILSEPGIYNALTKSLDIVPVVVANSDASGTTKIYYQDRDMVARVGNQRAKNKSWNTSYEGKQKQYIGMPAGALNDDPRPHIAGVFGGETDPKKADKLILMSSRDEITVYNMASVTRVGNNVVVQAWCSGDTDTEIIIGEEYSYVSSNGAIYVHPNHALFVGKRTRGLTGMADDNKASPFSTLLDTSGLDAALVKTASHEITYSAGAYFYGDNRMSKEGVRWEMQNEGFDNDSINEIIKTAQASPDMTVSFNEMSQTLKAILAEITESKFTLGELKNAISGQGEQEAQAPEQGGQPTTEVTDDQVPPEDQEALTQEIMEVAGSIGADGQAVIQAGKSQGMSLPQIAAQIHQEVAEVQQQGGQAPDQGQSQGSPMEQDMAAQGGQPPMDPNAQQQDPNAQPQVGGQAPDERSMQDLQQQGYNPNMTPEMLDQLQQIADKDVLNASIISYLVDTPDAKAVTSQYIEDITRGVNGLARTLLLIEVQRTNFVDQVGDKQLTTFLSRGKTLLNRMTDFVIDVSIIE